MGITPGPWSYDGCGIIMGGKETFIRSNGSEGWRKRLICSMDIGNPNVLDDTSAISALPDTLAELSRLRIENERLREACRTLMVIREPIKIATGDSFEKRLARAESLARAALEGR